MLLKLFPYRIKLVKYESKKLEGTVRVGGTRYLYNPLVQDEKKGGLGWTQSSKR